MQKTSNYNLNKPEAADPLRLADFNENADVIDAALNEVRTLAGTEQIRAGSFVGDNTMGRTVELGFTPKFILLFTTINSRGAVTLAGTEFGYYFNTSSEMKPTTSRTVSGGVYLCDTGNNISGFTTYYVAFL